MSGSTLISPPFKMEFETNSGAARLIDVIPIVDGLTTLNPMREILQIIEGNSGEVDFEIVLDPRPDYGRTEPRLKHGRQLGGVMSGRTKSWRSEAISTLIEGPRPAGRSVRAGERKYVSLSYVQSDLAVLSLLGTHADQRLKHTLEWWRGWSSVCSYAGPYGKRSCAVHSP